MHQVTEHCHRLPREMVEAISLEILKVRLKRALSKLLWWRLSLPAQTIL